ncbi:MAG: UDP-3-O-(3-hydroxymyristoyl)glucosamine N-acyltransferase [Gammaproteobacteria bacterium]|nr:UDP-3-O-(3-hydroxymyristoyl)glucosamine N-acyltransferase [Gammaproteobacteria bacterium]
MATLGELASRFDCRVQGDAKTEVGRVGTLSGATPDAISFLANPLYRSQLATTKAGAVIVAADAAGDSPVPCLISANPYATYARVAAFLQPPPGARAGIAPSAVVDDTAVVAASAEIGPCAVVGAGSRIGDAAIVGAGTVIGSGCEIGAATRLAPRVSILDGVRIGARCIVHSGTVIGADGFGFAQDGERWIKVPQLGTVVIGDDVEIGANTTIDRGAIEPTVLEDGVKLDNQIQIAHNARIGAHTVMAAFSGVAGSTTVGRRCMIAGGAVVVGHVTICDDVMVTFRSAVTKSITEPGTYGGSLPAVEASKWRRNAARFNQLDTLAQKVNRIERRLKKDD